MSTSLSSSLSSTTQSLEGSNSSTSSTGNRFTQLSLADSGGSGTLATQSASSSGAGIFQSSLVSSDYTYALGGLNPLPYFLSYQGAVPLVQPSLQPPPLPIIFDQKTTASTSVAEVPVTNVKRDEDGRISPQENTDRIIDVSSMDDTTTPRPARRRGRPRIYGTERIKSEEEKKKEVEVEHTVSMTDSDGDLSSSAEGAKRRKHSPSNAFSKEDPKYREMRRANNEAVKRNRDKAKRLQMIKDRELERLREKVASLEKELFEARQRTDTLLNELFFNKNGKTNGYTPTPKSTSDSSTETATPGALLTPLSG